MAYNLLAIAQGNRTKHIGVRLVLKYDILPWFVSAGIALLLFIGVAVLAHGANPQMTSDDVVANVYSWARPFYYALIVLAVFLARRSRDIWTWVLAGILIIFFVPQVFTNLAVAIFPNSILQAMVAMLGFLAVGRVVEYIHMRYIVGLTEPTLSVAALVSYGILISGALVCDTSFFFNLFWD